MEKDFANINLRLCTYNIRNTADRYEERKNLLKSVIQSFDFDIFAVQEIN